jgi:hypothetical protein
VEGTAGGCREVAELEATPITLEEAKQYRKELMEERSNKAQEQNRDFEMGEFNLCEH